MTTQMKIKFPEPPEGEGSVDCVSSKDLRPSLDWSLEFGWRLPMPPAQSLNRWSMWQMMTDNKAPSGSSLESDESASSQTSTSSFPHISRSGQPKDLLKQIEDFPTKDMQQTQFSNVASSIGGSSIGNSRADNLSSTFVGDVSAGVLGAIPAEERSYGNGFTDKLLVNETSPLNSSFCNSIEGTVGFGRACEQGQMAETNPEVWIFFKFVGTDTEISRSQGQNECSHI